MQRHAESKLWNATASRTFRFAVAVAVVAIILATALFAQSSQQQPPKQVYVVPFSHLDLWYLGPPENSYARVERIFSRALELSEHDPDFRFTFENGYYLREYLKLRPEAKKRVAAALASGHLDLSGQWSDMKQSPAAAEDLVRDVLLTHNFAKRELGFVPTGIVSGDIPGFTPQVVQIWKQSGIQGAMLTRGGPLKSPVFDWQALDGTKVRVGYTVGGYATGWMAGLASSIEAAEGKEAFSSYHSVQGKELKFDAGLLKTVSQHFPGNAPAILGAGPDLSVPSAQMTTVIKQWNQRHGSEATVRAVTVPEFVKATASSNVPALSGDWQSVWQMAAHSADRYVTLARTSHKLVTAEKVATIASLLTPMPYPGADLERAWQWHIAALDHEGAALPDFPRRANDIASEVEEQSAQMIASRIPTERKDAMVVAIVNPLGWQRTVAVRVPLYLHGDIPSDGSRWDNIIVRDEKGNKVEARIRPAGAHAVTRTAELYAVVDLPPMGYRSLVLEPAAKDASQAAAWDNNKPEDSDGSQPVTVQLGKWEARYDPATRAIALNKAGQPVGVVELDDMPGNAKAADLQSVRPIGDSAVQWKRVRRQLAWGESILRAETQIGQSRIYLQVALREGMAPEITSGGSWLAGFNRNVVQRVSPANFAREGVTYGIPFGEEKFGSMLPDSGPTNAGDELPPEAWKNTKSFDGWLAWDNGGSRVTFATEARAAIFSPKDFSIVVAPTRDVMPTEIQSIALKSALNAEDVATARPERLMWELMEPPVTSVAEDRFGEMNAPATFSLLGWSDPDLVVSAVYRDSDNDVVVRTYAHSAKPITGQLKTAQRITAIEQISPVETVIGPATASRSFRPWEIQTLRLHFGQTLKPAATLAAKPAKGAKGQ
jgi:hypothetical protein